MKRLKPNTNDKAQQKSKYETCLIYFLPCEAPEVGLHHQCIFMQFSATFYDNSNVVRTITSSNTRYDKPKF